MIVGVAGLGHIGGSMAKAARRFTTHRVLGLDRDNSALRAALAEGTIDGVLDEEGLSMCDLLLVALYPGAAVQFITQHARAIKKGSCVTDLCGIKDPLCEALIPIARRQGFHFVGGHPMAGKAEWGYRSSSEVLFVGAPMILTPSSDTPKTVMAMLTDFFLTCGFAGVHTCPASEHDRMIAYTSQLPHVIANAYVKGVSATRPEFFGGTFRDMTRVAELNVEMWTEIFLENRLNLAGEIRALIFRLSRYLGALEEGNASALLGLLEEGSEGKKEIPETGGAQ
ncbi:MAG: prephenate dehydrogenase [Thermovirgaceae bacterium]